jgi:anaerobic magnesium-protoporphyrin IX monomethyl ester cyclase
MAIFPSTDNILPPGRLKRLQAKARSIPSGKKVLLITPPSVFLLDERVFVSLGILKIAAVLEQAGCEVELLDLSGIENYLDVVSDHVAKTGAIVAALSTTTPQLPAAVKIAGRIRAARPDMRIVIGGPHITLVHSAVKLEQKAGRSLRAHAALEKLLTHFDVLVSGDGESAIFDAIAIDPPRIIDGDDRLSDYFMTDAEYDASPQPARHLVDMGSYNYAIDGFRATSLIAQLGCPYGCGFCGGRNSRSLRMIRTRTTASIVREIEVLHRDYGFQGFMFYDDELNVNKGLVELMNAITDLQIRLGTEFRLRGFVKAELFTNEQAAAMYRAGFRWLLCGFEAAYPRILENINKKATLEDNARVLEISKRHGLKVKALMSVGHPGETEESVLAVRDWLIDKRPDDFDCTVITTYPGTPYYDEALPHPSMPGVWTYECKKSKDRLHAYEVDFTEIAEYYKGDPEGGYHSYVFTDHVSADKLVELRNVVEKDVRQKLAIPFNAGKPAIRYEHSMGQGMLPPFILKRSS